MTNYVYLDPSSMTYSACTEEEISNKDAIEMLKRGGYFPIVGFDCEEGYQTTEFIRIEKILYREPATIVIWSDGTKTVSRCDQEDLYQPETGVALCILKRLFGGNKMRTLFEEWVPNNVLYEYDEDTEEYHYPETTMTVKDMLQQRKFNNN